MTDAPAAEDKPLPPIWSALFVAACIAVLLAANFDEVRVFAQGRWPRFQAHAFLDLAVAATMGWGLLRLVWRTATGKPAPGAEDEA